MGAKRYPDILMCLWGAQMGALLLGPKGRTKGTGQGRSQGKPQETCQNRQAAWVD